MTIQRFFVIMSIALSVIGNVHPVMQTAPSSVEFAWDVHGVLVELSVTGMAKVALTQGGLKIAQLGALLLFDCIRYPWSKKSGEALQLATGMYKKISSSISITSEELRPLIEAYDTELWDVSRRMAAEYYPIAGMHELLAELSELGYTQRCASNMGPPEYADLYEKHPSLFKYLAQGKLVMIHEKKPARKPEVRYFEEYKAAIPESSKKNILFIDDKKENALSATQAGLIGIHFKNVPQLRADLRALGIPVRS